jgi:hypothetical protein
VGATATQIHEAEILKRGFEHPALDVKSAMLAAVLQRGGVVDAIHDEFGTPKSLVRIDAFIIAIAVQEGAEKIVTNNVDEFKKLAGDRIAITSVPESASQPGLPFSEHDAGGD